MSNADPDLSAIIELLREWSQRRQLIAQAFAWCAEWLADEQNEPIASIRGQVRPEFSRQYCVFSDQYEDIIASHVVTELDLTLFEDEASFGTYELRSYSDDITESSISIDVDRLNALLA